MTLRANKLNDLVVSGDLEEFDRLSVSSKVMLISRLSDGLAMDLGTLRDSFYGPEPSSSRHEYPAPVESPTDRFSGRGFHLPVEGASA